MDVVPSPKFQEALKGVGEDVFEKAKELLTQIFEGKVKSAITEPMVIAFVCVAVSVQPVEFETISFTV